MVDKHREKLRLEKEEGALAAVREAVPYIGVGVCVLALEGTAWEADAAVKLLRGFEADKGVQLAAIQQVLWTWTACRPSLCIYCSHKCASLRITCPERRPRPLATCYSGHFCMASCGTAVSVSCADALQKRKELQAPEASPAASESSSDDSESDCDRRRSKRHKGSKSKKSKHKKEKSSKKKKRSDDKAKRKRKSSPDGIEVSLFYSQSKQLAA